jgi:hypothetical protein
VGGRLPHRAGKGLVIPCKGRDIELMKHPHPERVYTVSFSKGGGGGLSREVMIFLISGK